MIGSTDLKNGVTYLSYGQPCKVIKYSLIKMGRGGAVVKVQVRNLISGAVEEKSYSSNVKVDDVALVKRSLQYLYHDGVNAVFMDPQNYEQISINESVLKEELPFLKEGENASVLFWGDRALSADIPPKVTLKVTQTTPGIKGNSVSNMYKEGTLENGMIIKIPLFINEGEEVVVDTRNGDYVERAK